jgi:cysteine synthase A
VPAAPSAAAASPIRAGERDFVEQALADREQPVVMFALEWCEFCWSVRRLLGRLQIRYRAVDLDSVEFQRDDRGGRIRAALAERTSVATIPQIFIGGEFIGGATDLFDAWRGGRAQQLLERSGVDYDRSAKIDPYTFLPAWLQPR